MRPNARLRCHIFAIIWERLAPLRVLGLTHAWRTIMKKIAFAASAALFALSACNSAEEAAPEATETATVEATPTETVTATETATETATAEATPEATSTETPAE
jgi:hypothetical protein